MVSGSLGLLAFSASIFAGVWANNDMMTILIRAWWALIIFLLFGAIVGWIAQTVINEHLRQTSPDMVEQQDASVAQDKGLSGTNNAV
jgi:thiosulfate reductase cytochrome b subunit